MATGWQSWSTSAKSFIRFPFNYFPPKAKELFIPSKIVLPIKLKKPVFGWCSWYIFGRNINEGRILGHAKWIVYQRKKYKLPLDTVLIDDGWCPWGDWLTENKTKFPNGLKSLVNRISRLQIKSGIWIAPFLVDPKSQVALMHPEWLARKNGRRVEGRNLTPWDRYFPHKKWLLDITNPEVQQYLDDSIDYLLNTCGFSLIKLDFLYSVFFDPRLSGKQAHDFLRNFLKNIRRRYPHVYTIGCGCPLLPAVGVVDSMRIGPDTSPGPSLNFLLPKFFNRWILSKRVLPTISKRLWTKQIWNVDTDVFECRSEMGYTEKELLTFQNIIKDGKGNVFLGDDLTRLTAERIHRYIIPLFR
ncbi:MAG: Alpha-galactosidase [Candidatus Collierbacteria bacterium GW2011_GWC2_44_18]|uniref:Alpha-galactosidase n=2 Tax=Microgenomates group TaxID=1794810 RepID=A0A0G1J2U2_9BACT|nr:MAG: Alpha-galactosidase [Candidatus Collierbacteria bacterium GW2011_GWC2_44_18]KKT65585.1 MAG: Alpha-galactosidase [Candidatus Woesebacteria bacterium GW2011_GWA2_44_33]